MRGSAHQIFERYVALAREAAIGGDPIAAENLYQHAEHYLRVAYASRDDGQQGTPDATPPADTVAIETEPGSGNIDSDSPRLGWGDDRPGFI